ncbi:MAG: hypothetical protein LBB62_08920 [Proteiniphilum sp.]|jgi:hypothetical protein|nr:hypothetical protein [Proteiniphilum sp.]
MRKLFFSLCLLCLSIAAKAQFEQGKWIVNPSITGLDFSYSSHEGVNFGVSGQVGAFLIDNTALLVAVGGDWSKPANSYNTSVGGRYYFQTTGIYLGAGLKMKHWKTKSSGSVTNFGAFAETGYAFFITKTITLEPAIYYDLSFKDSTYSKFGLKVGFGLYF